MKFIIKKIYNKLSVAKKLLAVSCKLSALRKKPLAISYQLPAFPKLKAILSAFRNLKPKTYNLKPSFHNLQPTTYNLQPTRGFTLIETLVAISILMVAVASPLTIAQKGLASAIYAKDQIIASYLAQDAIEYIINLSGKNVASECNWLSGDGGACVSGVDIKTPCVSSCKVDTRGGANSISLCSGETCKLLYNDSDRIYSYSSGNASSFTRSVKIEENPANEALITVTMSWKDKETTRTLVFYTRIYNWKS